MLTEVDWIPGGLQFVDWPQVGTCFDVEGVVVAIVYFHIDGAGGEQILRRHYYTSNRGMIFGVVGVEAYVRC